MSQTYATLSTLTDQFAFCDGVYQILVDHYGESEDVEQWPEEHRNVFLVWRSAGIIAEGAFNALFHSGLPGDPDFSLMRRAYETIGCQEAIDALTPVFHLFPDGVPPEDSMERLRYFVRGNKAVDGQLNRNFTKAQAPLTAAVAAYIRPHADLFRAIEGTHLANQKQGEARQGARISDIVLIGLPRLPIWVQVAYAARCARIVLPLFQAAWPDASEEHPDSLSAAVRLAELSATEGGPMGNLHHAIMQVGLVGVDVQETAAKQKELDSAAANIAMLVVNSAGSAANAAAKITEALDSYRYAYEAAESAGKPELIEQMQTDYKKIRDFSRDYDWNDSTPLPPEAFRSGYQPTRKSWWRVWKS